MSIFGQRLKLFREKKQILAKDLANALGVQPSSIVNWEKGYNNPRLDTVYEIANFLQISIVELLCDGTLLPLSEEDKHILTHFHSLSSVQQQEFLDYLEFLFTKNEILPPPPRKKCKVKLYHLLRGGRRTYSWLRKENCYGLKC